MLSELLLLLLLLVLLEARTDTTAVLAAKPVGNSSAS